MSKHQRGRARERGETPLDVSHLRRETRTALELAIVALAPSKLIDRLAVAAGLLEAMSELPSNSPPALALMPKTAERARRALLSWHEWEDKHAHRGLA